MDYVTSGSGGPPIAAVNMDARSLAACHAVTKVQIGVDDGGGFGAGGDPDLGKLAVEHDIEMIRGLFTDTDIVVVVTCLGGGTGTGATPVILDAARAAGVFTIVLATLPFSFEGAKRQTVAEAGMASLLKAADVVCGIRNDALFEASSGDDVKVAFTKADEMLGTGVYALWQMLVQPAFVGIDLADLQGVSSESGGPAWFGFGSATGVGREQAAVKMLLKGAGLDKGRMLRDSDRAVVCVVGSHDLRLTEVSDVMSVLARETADTCALAMGTVINDKWRDRIMIAAFVADPRRAVPSATRPAKHSKTTSGHRRIRKRDRDLQNKLKLDVSGKGRFNNVEATIMDGEDLDIPTFIRRGLTLEK